MYNSNIVKFKQQDTMAKSNEEMLISKTSAGYATACDFNNLIYLINNILNLIL